MKKYIFIVMGLLLCLCGCGGAKESKETAKTATATPEAKATAAPTATPEAIDPAYDGDYSQPADYIFVTHEHDDHNNVDLVTMKKATKTYHYNNFLKKGKYETVKLDGIKLYHAGDTSYIDEMKALTKPKLDYALLPIDGSYNMEGKEATKCANIIGAKHNVPIHTSTVQSPIDMDNVALFTPSNVQVIEYGKPISLKHN